MMRNHIWCVRGKPRYKWQACDVDASRMKTNGVLRSASLSFVHFLVQVVLFRSQDRLNGLNAHNQEDASTEFLGDRRRKIKARAEVINLRAVHGFFEQPLVGAQVFF